jgi:RNA polymerase sigma-70 factor (ECF subfamily)
VSVLDTATVSAMEPAVPLIASPVSPLDAESHEWLRTLRADDPTRQIAIERLHALLLRAARFEVARRQPNLPHLRGNEFDDIASEAAADALMSVLRRLDDFRGDSRFTTWAYKFALLEAAVKLRKRAWQGREIPLESEGWDLFETSALGPAGSTEQRELVTAVQLAIAEVLTPHQRSVLVALAVNGVPIDVLADRLNSNRGALYKTLHDARRKLRKHLSERGLALDTWLEEE